MAGFGVQVKGLPEVLRALEDLRAGTRELGLKRDRIESEEPYSFGMNYGRYRNGRLARRAGPTHFFEAGIQAIEESAHDQLAAALPKGPASVKSAWSVLIRRGVTAAERTAPVKSGRLRSSIHAADGGRA
jgi:hypothetical protein